MDLPWEKLPEKERFSTYDEFEELPRYVEAYFTGPMFENIFEEMDGLRHHMQPILRSQYFTDEIIAANLGVARSTARRFLRHNKRPSFQTFRKMMVALAEQYGIEDMRDRIWSKAPHDIEVEQQGPVKTARSETHDALDDLLDALDSLVPASQHSPDSNRQPVELTAEQYNLLVATVRSAQAFSEVETWDQKTIRVIRALNDILLELDKLLETATSIFGKRLRGALKMVTKPLRTILDALDGAGRKGD